MKFYYWMGDRFRKSKYPEEIFVNTKRVLTAACHACGRSRPNEVINEVVEVSDGRAWPDFLDSGLSAIASERVIKLWNSEKLRGYTSYPLDVRVDSPAMPPLSWKYYCIAIPFGGLLPDPRRTLGRWGPTGKDVLTMDQFPTLCKTCGIFPDGKTFWVKSFAPDESTWNGDDVLRWGSYLFCTERVAKLCLSNHLTNMFLQLPAEAGNTSAAPLDNLD